MNGLSPRGKWPSVPFCGDLDPCPFIDFGGVGCRFDSGLTNEDGVSLELDQAAALVAAPVDEGSDVIQPVNSQSELLLDSSSGSSRRSFTGKRMGAT